MSFFYNSNDLSEKYDFSQFANIVEISLGDKPYINSILENNEFSDGVLFLPDNSSVSEKHISRLEIKELNNLEKLKFPSTNYLFIFSISESFDKDKLISVLKRAGRISLNYTRIVLLVPSTYTEEDFKEILSKSEYYLTNNILVNNTLKLLEAVKM